MDRRDFIQKGLMSIGVVSIAPLALLPEPTKAPKTEITHEMVTAKLEAIYQDRIAKTKPDGVVYILRPVSMGVIV